MKTIYIFRHVACEGPGHLAEFLDRRGIAHRLIRVDAGEALPENIGEAAGLAFMGGSMSVNDDLPWIPRALALIREAHAARRPVLGHCLGAQLIAKALGAEVTPNPVPEIGWFPVTACDGAAARYWLDGLGPEFEVFHWHGETFSIPPGAERLLASRACANQAFAVGRTLALQFHVEMTAPMVREWAREYAQQIAAPRETVQSASELTTDLDARIARLARVAEVLYARWIEGLDLEARASARAEEAP